jgi:DNA-binding NarL/FixJ family response regulator
MCVCRILDLGEAVEYALSTDGSKRPASLTPEQASLGSQLLNLTRREEEIAALVARGMTNRQIASELSISEHTAATHIRRILKKLGLRSRAQVASWLTQQQP